MEYVPSAWVVAIVGGGGVDGVPKLNAVREGLLVRGHDGDARGKEVGVVGCDSG